MHDVHGAIDALKEITGLPDLALGPDGHAEIVFEGRPVGLVAAGGGQLELVTPIDSFGRRPDDETLRRLMTANYLGSATGPARLALDPGREQIVLGQRLGPQALDLDALHLVLKVFLATAAFWDGPDGKEALAGPSEAANDLSVPSLGDFIIRG